MVGTKIETLNVLDGWKRAAFSFCTVKVNMGSKKLKPNLEWDRAVHLGPVVIIVHLGPVVIIVHPPPPSKLAPHTSMNHVCGGTVCSKRGIIFWALRWEIAKQSCKKKL